MYPAQPQQGYPMQNVHPAGATVYPHTAIGYPPSANPEMNPNPNAAYTAGYSSPYPTAGGNMPPTSAPPPYQDLAAAPNSGYKQPL